MDDEEKRKLIKTLRFSVNFVGSDIGSLLDRASDALEDTLWKPIEDMPEE